MNTPNPPIVPTPSSTPSLEPRRLEAGRGSAWWGEGWRIFTAAPGPWIAIAVLFVLIAVVLAVLPVVGSIAQAIVVPVLAGGVMLGCQALARGEPLTVAHLFEGFRAPHLTPLIVLGLLNLAFGIVMMLLMMSLVFGAAGMAGMGGMMSSDPGSAALAAIGSFGSAAVLGVLIALLLSAVWAMAYWFAPALIVLDGASPIAALKASFAASMHNIGAFLIYGLIFIALALVASIPFGLGWLVLGPVIAGSTYAGWREIFSGPR